MTSLSRNPSLDLYLPKSLGPLGPFEYFSVLKKNLLALFLYFFSAFEFSEDSKRQLREACLGRTKGILGCPWGVFRASFWRPWGVLDLEILDLFKFG